MTKRSIPLLLVLVASAFADTLTLRDGTSVSGTWVGIDSRQISFLVNEQIRTYPRSDIAKVTFGPAPSPQSPSSPGARRQKVELGMTADQVIAIVGRPDGVVEEAGAKQIYSYGNSKVTFVDGKVTEIIQ